MEYTHTHIIIVKLILLIWKVFTIEKVERVDRKKRREEKVERLNEINEYSRGGYIFTQEDISAVDPRYVFTRMGIETKSFVIVDVMESSRGLIDLEPLIIFHSTVLDFPSIYQRGRGD